ncbi:MAG: cytidine deaminase [Spirochaetales bacterium]|nr:cytidine deaminase [Spirochaetales bacterium]
MKERLVEEALEARENSYAPYSEFRVGAAILTETGNIYRGCNVENASFGATICAERGAAMTAIGAEGRVRFKAIAIASSSENPAPPCGMCLQFLAEFMGPEAPVYLVSSVSGTVREYTFGTLMPLRFTEF